MLDYINEMHIDDAFVKADSYIEEQELMHEIALEEIENMQINAYSFSVDGDAKISWVLATSLEEAIDFFTEEIAGKFITFGKYILPMKYTVGDVYEEYKHCWCKEHGVLPNDLDEELGVNGECYVCFEEFVQNDMMLFLNERGFENGIQM